MNFTGTEAFNPIHRDDRLIMQIVLLKAKKSQMVIGYKNLYCFVISSASSKLFFPFFNVQKFEHES
jgi:hypothetical protein